MGRLRSFKGSETYTYIRRTAVEVANGRERAVDGPESARQWGTFDPLPGDLVRTLPEGERRRKQRYLITEAELQASDDETGQLGDIVIYAGERWEVRDIMPYRGGILPHYEVRIMRVEQG